MNILVAGAAGVIGRRLLPLLAKDGHNVVGTTRQASKSSLIEELGASPVVVDVFDREELHRVVRATQPDVIIHQLTDLGDRDFVANGRIRRVGTRNLVDAARAVGVRRMIAQSIAWAYAPGEGPADESVPLDVESPLSRRGLVESIQALEQAVLEMEHGIVLRYGLFYGPGTWYAPDGFIAEQVRHGESIANEGVTSFVHIDDAARATLEALVWPAGIVNIVDDEPASGSCWLPVYAAALNTPAPPVDSTRPPFARGALNTKARQRLNWQPIYPSWRDGFAK
ncbi:NAD-dependent epimerase/dehydratase family protein [Dictyobacter formicarum]|uniref:dTDP-glucose 4,6-dehydratase n=1 Tax=Dictyobacter formicarum TaxID=2778368 RepID=A0ABQ3VTY9_9CHLR|nr:NAD(P)-dependent oxidoreductase [Dictyobacter formicarum]GHO89347.1 dTDP-glucose 4,6-dehydratase [Dictyobacter formicarum]